MKNADYDIKEKSDIEVLDAFEGSGVTDPEEESENDVIVDQNFNEPVEGSSELWFTSWDDGPVRISISDYSRTCHSLLRNITSFSFQLYSMNTQVCVSYFCNFFKIKITKVLKESTHVKVAAKSDEECDICDKNVTSVRIFIFMFLSLNTSICSNYYITQSAQENY